MHSRRSDQPRRTHDGRTCRAVFLARRVGGGWPNEGAVVRRVGHYRHHCYRRNTKFFYIAQRTMVSIVQHERMKSASDWLRYRNNDELLVWSCASTNIVVRPTAVRAIRRTSFARRSFNTAAPLTWNSLPPAVLNCDSLSTFKSRLKTHLFSTAFC